MRLRLSKGFLRPGDRVIILAEKDVGSAKLLDDLTAEVVGPHPIARNWYKIRLDPNSVTAHADWSAPAERLMRLEEYRKGERAFFAGKGPSTHFP